MRWDGVVLRSNRTYPSSGVPVPSEGAYGGEAGTGPQGENPKNYSNRNLHTKHSLQLPRYLVGGSEERDEGSVGDNPQDPTVDGTVSGADRTCL